jgi:hypothetical protein
MSQTIRRLDFVHMHPENDIVKAVLPPGASVRALVNPGNQYIIYIRTSLDPNNHQPKTQFAEGELSLQISLPQGNYNLEWLDPKTCASIRRTNLPSSADLTLSAPAFQEDLALVIRR